MELHVDKTNTALKSLDFLKVFRLPGIDKKSHCQKEQEYSSESVTDEILHKGVQGELKVFACVSFGSLLFESSITATAMSQRQALPAESRVG